MKKLRMIVTSVVVLAIVGSTFAFNFKKANWCVAANTSSPTCMITILEDRKITTVGADYHYFNGWDGNASTCGGNNNCTSLVTLTTD